MKHFLKYLVVSSIFLSSCGSDESDNIPVLGFEYFPLQKGFYQIYDVEETVYSEVSLPEKEIFQLLTEVADSFPNEKGTTTYVIRRSTRVNENAPWALLDTWSARMEEDELVINEGNIPFVKLAIPLKSGRTWDGNKYNTQKEDVYKVKAIEKSYEVNNRSFNNIVIIEQEHEDDPIVFTDLREEVYAEDVGLVYKEVTQLHYCTKEFCLNDQIIEYGIEYKQTIREYGRK